MAEQLNLVPKVSLKEMALRRVAISLWNDSSVFAQMQKIKMYDKSIYSIFRVVSRQIIDRVKEKVPKLMLPESLKGKIMRLIAPVGNEILRWKMSHQWVICSSQDYLLVHILERLCWTCIGAVDYQKTAEELIHLEKLDIKMRYSLACYYCLQDYIPFLWKQLPDASKEGFNDKLSPLSSSAAHLEGYWSSVMMRHQFELNILPAEFVNESSTYQSFFKYLACRGSKAAIEYFFKKLAVEERDDAVFKTLCDALERDTKSYELFDLNIPLRSDKFFYLLSLMTQERQMEVFEKHPSGCLMFFVGWPWQDFCLDILNIIWNFIPENQYGNVLDRLHRNLGTCYNFPDFFQKFFIHSPIKFRQSLLFNNGQFGILWFFSRFVNAEDGETIKVILENISSDDRMRLVTSENFFAILLSFIRSDKWHLVSLCIGEATLSRKEREILKQVYMGFPIRDWKKYKGLFEVLTGTSTDSTKCLSGDNLNKAEKPYNEEEKCKITKKLKRF